MALTSQKMLRKKSVIAFFVAFLVAISFAVPAMPSLCLASPGGRPPSEVFSKLKHKEITATYEQIEDLAAYAASRKNNVFEMLRDMSLFLARQRSVVRLLGTDLRKVGATFALGNAVVRAILPLDHVVEIQIGYSSANPGSPQIEVTLDGHDVSTRFYFLIFPVTLHFEKNYGINLVTDTKLDSIYGATAERLGESAQVLGVTLLRSTRIGVELDPGPSPTIGIAPILRKTNAR